jgi:DNA-binding NtrC family response regulator
MSKRRRRESGYARSIRGGLGTGGGGAAVLVVDDEPAIRLLCRVNLELDGHAVLEASSLDEARRHLDGQEVSLALLDMRVGPDRGEALLDELEARGIPVILISGSAEIQPAIARRVVASLGKPFAIDDLLTAVRSAAR